jgi:hypothetical protein
MLSDKKHNSAKKGITQADWAISLGIFILYLSVVFLLIRPLIDNTSEQDTQTDSITTFLKTNTTTTFYTIPITGEQNDNPLFLTPIALTDRDNNLRSSEATLTDTNDQHYDYYLLDDFLIAFADTANRELDFSYPKDKTIGEQMLPYNRTQREYDLSSDESSAHVSDQQIEYALTNQKITQLTYQGSQVITDWVSERNGEEITPTNDSFLKGTFFAAYQGDLPKDIGSANPADHYTQTQTQLIFANTSTALLLYSATPAPINLDETGGTIPLHSYHESILLSNFTTLETASETTDFTESCLSETADQIGLSSSQETITFTSPIALNASACNTNGTTTLSLTVQQKVTEPWFLSLTLSDTSFDTDNTIMIGTPQFREKKAFRVLSRYENLETIGYQTFKRRLQLNDLDNFRIELSVPDTKQNSTDAKKGNIMYNKTIFAFGSNLSRSEEIISSSSIVPLLAMSNTTSTYPFMKQVIYRW